MSGTMSFLTPSGEAIPTQTPLIIKRTIENAAMTLKGLGARFLIIMPGGERLGDIVESAPAKPAEEPKKKRTKQSPILGYGVAKAIISPLMDHLQPGQMASIPFLDSGPRATQSVVTARASALWGPGSCTSLITETHVEILRHVIPQPRSNGKDHDEVRPPV